MYEKEKINACFQSLNLISAGVVAAQSLFVHHILGRVTGVAFSLVVEQNVWLTVCHDLFGHLLHLSVVEMQPAAFVLGVGCVVTVAGAAAVVDNHSDQIVHAIRVGATRFWPAVQDELRQVECIDGEANAQVDFSSAREIGVRLNISRVRLNIVVNFLSNFRFRLNINLSIVSTVRVRLMIQELAHLK